MKMIYACLLSCALFVRLPAQEVSIKVKNPAPFDRPVETIEVNWADLTGKLEISGEDLVEVIDNGKSVVSQTIDEDANGIPDMIIWQAAFKSGEEKTFLVRKTARKTGFPAITDAKYILPRKDVAWENDRIAFRIYGGPLAGDVRNGLDVWVKRVPYQIIDKWYGGDSLKGSKRVSYHVDHGEGADYFNVGKSLGAGGSALWKGGVLCQPGLFKDQKIIATGPIRAIFRVSYDADTHESGKAKEYKTYTLDAGQNMNKIDISYSLTGGGEAVEVAAGLVKRKNTVCYSDNGKAWLSLWGPTDDDSTHGSIGTGIVIPKEFFKEMREDSSHYLLIGSTTPAKEMTYYAGAGWTGSGHFKTKEDWNEYLSSFAERISYTMKVTVAEVKK